MATIDELIASKSAATYQTEILADLADPAVVGGTGLPVTSWQAGSTPRTLVASQAQLAVAMNDTQRALANSCFLSTAVAAWLTLHAFELFQEDRSDPVATIGIAKLTDAGGGPHVVAAGDLLAQDSNGYQFRNLTGGTLALSGTLDLRWQAVATGALYNIGVNTLTSLVTSLTSVTINNPATWLSLPGTVASAARGTIRITDGAATGPHVVGAGTITVGNGAGINYTNVNAFTIITAGGYADVLFEAAAVGLAYNLANGTITTVVVTPVAGLTSNNPGTTWITTAGADEGSDPVLRTTCRNKWSRRGVGWTSAAINYLATSHTDEDTGLTVPATSTPVTRVRVTTNPGGIAGLIGVTVGSVVGAMNAADVAIVQAYFDDERTTLTSTVTVSSCTNVTIALTGTVRVPAAFSAAIQLGVTNRTNSLAQTTPVGGEDNKSNSVIWEDIVAALMGKVFDATTGAQTSSAVPYDVDITAVTVGGVPGVVAADIALTAAQVPVFDLTGLTYTVV